MLRKRASSPGLALVLLVGLAIAPRAAEAADYPAPQPTETGTYYCHDPYCGLRAYPDPYIWDGYRKSVGYRGEDYYRRWSWYVLSRARAVELLPVYPYDRRLKDHAPKRRPLYTK